MFWKRKSPITESPRTAAEEYAIIEKIYLDGIVGSRRAIPDLLVAGNYAWAGTNFCSMAQTYVELGLLHWRAGQDPRPAFEGAIEAFDRLSALAQERQLKKQDYEFPDVYAMLYLMGREVSIEFHEPDYHKEHRWPCYLCCIVHGLHDQQLDSYHEQLLNTYLGADEEFADHIVRTYFKLLEAHADGDSIDALATEAEANWLKRKTSSFFADAGPFSDGYGLSVVR